ncbi:MAG: HEAT repeat domain-containing protein [bacterium]
MGGLEGLSGLQGLAGLKGLTGLGELEGLAGLHNLAGLESLSALEDLEGLEDSGVLEGLEHFNFYFDFDESWDSNKLSEEEALRLHSLRALVDLDEEKALPILKTAIKKEQNPIIRKEVSALYCPKRKFGINRFAW